METHPLSFINIAWMLNPLFSKFSSIFFLIIWEKPELSLSFLLPVWVKSCWEEKCWRSAWSNQNLEVLGATCVADLRIELLLHRLYHHLVPADSHQMCAGCLLSSRVCDSVSKKGNLCTSESANTENHDMGDGIALCIWDHTFVG